MVATERTPMEFSDLLEQVIEQGASDLFLSVGAPPQIKVEGILVPLGSEALSSSRVYELVYSILSDAQTRTFEATSELNMALRIKGIGRFRVNVFRQMSEVALVARYINSNVPSIADLGLPAQLQDLVMEPRGLILLVGGTGTGKSTTLASMIDYRNSNKTGHILSIEDPVEFVHAHKMSLVNQREVGLDTESYAVALKNAMREAPDVILIGEIRDAETMKSAITYSETGHLCLSTLHANNANQAIDRILNFFPDDAHKQTLLDLSLNLRAIVSQRLPRGTRGKRVAAIEVMLNTPYISDLISKGDVTKIKEAMIQARELGCQTFDDALFDLVEAGKLSDEEALRHADSRTNLALRFKLEGKHAASEVTIKKDIAYAKFIDFTNYKSYRIRRINVSDDCADRAGLLDESLRVAMFAKGLAEDENQPDLELQYVFTSHPLDALKLQEIENPVSAGIDVKSELRRHGVIKINLADMHTSKAVWRVTASRELALKPRSQAQFNKDTAYLFSEFPPESE
jgi:twitching motility protein PilU